MATEQSGTADAVPVERFQPTSGQALGWAGLLLAAAGIGYVLTSVHTLTGLRAGTGLAFFGVLVWATQLRSRATAYPDTLRLRNVVSDTVIPLHLVDEVSITRTLNVWVGDRRYVCIGIGRSWRAVLRTGRGSTASLVGLGRLQRYAADNEHPALDQSAMAYETFVVTRIADLVARAKRSPAVEPAQVRQRPARWAIAAIAGTGVAFAVSLLL